MEEGMKHLFGGYEYLAPTKKGVRLNENGELLRYFCIKLNPSRESKGYKPLTIKGVQKILKHMSRKRDLYWLKSVCDDAENRGGSVAFSKKFWWIAKQQKAVEDLPKEFF